MKVAALPSAPRGGRSVMVILQIVGADISLTKRDESRIAGTGYLYSMTDVHIVLYISCTWSCFHGVNRSPKVLDMP